MATTSLSTLTIAAMLTLTMLPTLATMNATPKKKTSTQAKVNKRFAQTKTDGSEVILIGHAKVAAGFSKGAVLLIHDNYRIHAGARDQGGLPEVHEHDTDIFHILEGSATFVTGGVVVDPVIPAPGEIQGKEIKGGETWQLVKGDVIVIPPKVPHWFKEVPGTIKYFVVKVR
ncbi:MAG: hypothetical protein H0T92_23775 [Pyrinomonadaceae bacterium]|nr:hypothetical protein [Pyrinomonadaceae bacterium]